MMNFASRFTLRKPFLLLATLLFAFTVSIGATNARAATLTVTSTLDDGSAGTLRSQIAAAAADDTIVFQNGLTGTIVLDGTQINIDKSLTIQGPGANVLLISGNNSTPILFTNAPIRISGVTLTQGKGSGIRNSGTLTLTNCTILNTNNGSGILNFGPLTVTNCTISGNAGPSGAGINNGNDARLIVSNSTISGNSANAGSGGGISSGAGVVNVSNSTIFGNAASGDGGGIFNEDGANGILILNNNIVAGNSAGGTGPDIRGIIDNGDYNLIQSTGGVELFGFNDITGVDPRLGPLANNGGRTQTRALLTGSPAINRGNPNFDASTIPFDQRGTGFARVVGGRVDLGAYEVQSGTTPNPTPTPVPTTPPTSEFTGTLSGRAVLSRGTATTSDDISASRIAVLVRSFETSSDFAGDGRYAQLVTADTNGRFRFLNVPSDIDLQLIFNPDKADVPTTSGISYTGPNPDIGRRVIPDAGRTGTARTGTVFGAIVVPEGRTFIVNDGAGDALTDNGTPIVVPSGVSVSGRVQLVANGTTTSVSGATVTIRSSTLTRTTTTASNGTYSFIEIPVGTYTVTATKGTQTKSVTVTVTRTSNFVVPTLFFSEQAVRGAVTVQSNGSQTAGPAIGATVTLSRGGVVLATTTTDAKGTYVFPAVPAGNYIVRATLNGATNFVQVSVLDGSPTTALTIKLVIQGVSGVVRLNGVVFAGATVSALLNGRVVATTTSGAGGFFIFGGLATGTYAIRAAAQGDTSVARTATVSSGQTTAIPDLLLFLETLSGKVTFNGAAASSATVELLQFGRPVRSAVTTTSTGVFSFSGLTAGTYVLRASRNNTRAADVSVTIARGVNQTGIALRLLVQNVSGRVLLNNSLADALPVFLLRGSTLIASTTTAPDGSYGFGGVAAGTYTVRASSRLGDVASQPVTVTSGVAAVVADIRLLLQTVAGRVTVNGVAAPGVRVQLFSAATRALRATAITNFNGNYSFAQINSGSYFVTATRGGQSKSSATLAVARNGGTAFASTINLVQQIISGSVRLDGVLAGGALVRLRQGAISVATTTTSDENGKYQFGGVFSGSYTVTASLAGDADFKTISVATGANVLVSTIFLTAASTTPTPTPPTPAPDFVVGRIYQVSVPYADTNEPSSATTAARAFGVSPTDTRGRVNYTLYKFDAVNQAKIFITGGGALLRRGEGYFIEPKLVGVSLRKPSTDASRIPTPVTSFVITLRKNVSLDDPSLPVSQQNNGYNLIGFPFDPARFSIVNWLQSSVDVPAGTRATGATFQAAHFDTVPEAVAAGFMSDELFTLIDDGSRTYENVTQMVPFKGYYARTYVDNVRVTLKAATP